MKKTIALIVFLLLQLPATLYACEVCKENQPKILRGITHGAGPQSKFDYFIIIISSIVVLITLFLSIKLLIKPKESAPDHIKNYIVE